MDTFDSNLRNRKINKKESKDPHLHQRKENNDDKEEIDLKEKLLEQRMEEQNYGLPCNPLTFGIMATSIAVIFIAVLGVGMGLFADYHFKGVLEHQNRLKDRMYNYYYPNGANLIEALEFLKSYLKEEFAREINAIEESIKLLSDMRLNDITYCKQEEGIKMLSNIECVISLRNMLKKGEIAWVYGGDSVDSEGLGSFGGGLRLTIRNRDEVCENGIHVDQSKDNRSDKSIPGYFKPCCIPWIEESIKAELISFYIDALFGFHRTPPSVVYPVPIKTVYNLIRLAEKNEMKRGQNLQILDSFVEHCPHHNVKPKHLCDDEDGNNEIAYIDGSLSAWLPFNISTMKIDSKYYLGIDRKNFNRTRDFVENLIEYLYNNTHNHNYELRNQTVQNCAKYFEEKKVDNVEEQFEKYKKLVYENIMFELFVRLTGQPFKFHHNIHYIKESDGDKFGTFVYVDNDRAKFNKPAQYLFFTGNYRKDPLSTICKFPKKIALRSLIFSELVRDDSENLGKSLVAILGSTKVCEIEHNETYTNREIVQQTCEFHHVLDNRSFNNGTLHSINKNVDYISETILNCIAKMKMRQYNDEEIIAKLFLD